MLALNSYVDFEIYIQMTQIFFVYRIMNFVIMGKKSVL